MLEGKRISELDLVTNLRESCCFPVLSNGATKRVTFGSLLSQIENKLPETGIEQVKEDVAGLKNRADEMDASIETMNTDVENVKETVADVGETIMGQNATIRNCVSTVEGLEQVIETTHFDDVLELENDVRANTTNITSINEKIPAQASAENKLADSASVERKQDALTQTQLDAVNSGITAEKVAQYDEGMTPAGIVNLIYPVGSIYISVNNVNPSTLFGGTWEEISKGRVLQGATDDQNGGDEIAAGLPNIKGRLITGIYNFAEDKEAFSFEYCTASQAYWQGVDNFPIYSVRFDASESNPIYRDDCNTVQMPAIAVYFWKRTA